MRRNIRSLSIVAFALALAGCSRKPTETKTAAVPAATVGASSAVASIPGLQPPSDECPDMGDGKAITAYDWASRYKVERGDVDIMRVLPTLDQELKTSLGGLDRSLFEACASIVKTLGAPSAALGTHDVCVAAGKALVDAKKGLGPTGAITLDVKPPTCQSASAPADCTASCAGDPAACSALCDLRRIPLLACTGAKVAASIKGGDAALVAKLQTAIESAFPALVIRASSHEMVSALAMPTVQVLRGIDSHLGAISIPDDQRQKLGKCVAPLEQHLADYFTQWGDGDALAKSLQDSI
jgi:hypothetical protein